MGLCVSCVYYMVIAFYIFCVSYVLANTAWIRPPKFLIFKAFSNIRFVRKLEKIKNRMFLYCKKIKLFMKKYS